MDDTGKVLQQAEIDVIFKNATGRAMASTATDDTPDDDIEDSVTEAATPEVPVEEKETPSVPQHEGTVLNEILRKLDSLTECVTTLENRIEELEIKTNRVGELRDRISLIAGEMREERTHIKKISGNIESLVDVLKNTPGAGMRRYYTCNNCGSQGYPVIPVKCSVCGEEGWWGWFSEK